ncbi:MAG TPA: hypothetical protein H9671_10880 [Firmicutes bacterium]|nr:hypothetical protein [Bacillota bacterium]
MFKKLSVMALSAVVAMSLAMNVSAAHSVTRDAMPGSATIDGVKDASYDAAKVIDMNVTGDDLPAGDTTAQAYILYDDAAIYFFVDVTDPSIDCSSSLVHEQDSVEIFTDWENIGDQFRLSAEGEVSGSTEHVKEYAVQKTDKGYAVEAKVEYAAKAGESILFCLQVNDCSQGLRNNTIQVSADGSTAWESIAGYETLVFAEGASTETSTETSTDVESSTETTSEVESTPAESSTSQAESTPAESSAAVATGDAGIAMAALTLAAAGAIVIVAKKVK